MSGRVTSRHPSVNDHGVPLVELLDQVKANNNRIEGALRHALHAWQIADAARVEGGSRADIVRLTKQAREITRKVLS